MSRSPLANVYDKNPTIDHDLTQAFRRMDGVDKLYFDSDASDDCSVKSGPYSAIDLHDRITVEREDHSTKTMTVEEFLKGKDRFLPGKTAQDRLELVRKAAFYELPNGDRATRHYDIDPAVAALVQELDPRVPASQTQPASPLVASVGHYTNDFQFSRSILALHDSLEGMFN